ncbi:unnamed protein product [Ectocarpus sp. 6 AP-2014]
MGGQRSCGLLFLGDNFKPVQLTSTNNSSNQSQCMRGYGTTASPTVAAHASHQWRSADNECAQREARPNQQPLRAGERPRLQRSVAGVAIFLFGAAALSAVFSGWGSRDAVGALKTTLGERHPSGADVVAAAATFPVPRILTVRASNVYGEFNKGTLGTYGLDMVIEPFRETTLAVEGNVSLSRRYVWRLQHGSNHGVTAKDAGDAWAYSGGPQATVTVDSPGTVYVLTVREVSEDGQVVAEARVEASCKYVRREIRELTDRDREAFFDAMQTWYTIPNSVGKTTYGPDFSNYMPITAIHGTEVENFCYHQGMQFLTSHAAFDLTMERYLQMIDPTVSLPVWDYMIDSAWLGLEWYESEIFQPDWFGSAMSDVGNHFMVAGGRFGNVSTIYDPDDTLTNSRLKPTHNPYGYVSSPHNYQDLPRLTRTSSYCGLQSRDTLATLDAFLGCFEESRSFYDWEHCMQYKIHGDIHGLLGGAFDCNTDMADFSAEHPEYSHGLLAFTLQILTFKFTAWNILTPDDNTCDANCVKGQTEPCGCTCLIDAFAIPDEQVYGYMEAFMDAAMTDFSGYQYITHDEEAAYPYGFIQDGRRMSDEHAMFLMRTLVKIGCEPGAVGTMSSTASPVDPLFWVLHPLFDKAMHILLLSPKYDEYTMEWVDGECPGSGYTDELPITERSLGLGPGTDYLTNQQLLELLYPSNPALPYVYTDLPRWGDEDTELV